MKKTFQEKNWGGKFGKDYTLRNPQSIEAMNKLYLQNYGTSRDYLNKEFLKRFSHSLRILELGTNVGVQLLFLQKMGFKNLYGIEMNRDAVELSKKISKGIDIIQGSALDIPFKDDFFDIVFTSGVLIHISPKDIKKVLKEIYRCSKKYIWGFEYYAEKYTEINYRGHKNILWKNNFSKLYRNLFKRLKLVREKKLKYLNNENEDLMFLLEKK